MNQSIPDERRAFRTLPLKALFHLPHDPVIYVKTAAVLADVLPAWRHAPTAPRAGWYHPAPSQEVQPLPAAAQVLGTIVELTLLPDGFLTLAFATAEDRMTFLAVLAPVLDAGAMTYVKVAQAVGTPASDLFTATLHHTDLALPLHLPLAQVT